MWFARQRAPRAQGDTWVFDDVLTDVGGGAYKAPSLAEIEEETQPFFGSSSKAGAVDQAA
jgi:hypothetical protein